MVAWMIYAVATGAVLAVVGLLAERGLRLLARPGRWAWLFVMLASVVWPFVSGAVLGSGLPGSGGVAISPGWESTPGAVADWSIPAELAGGALDTLLLGGWLLASTVLLAVLVLSTRAVRGEQRRWRGGVVSGEPVLLSGRLGPAVIGTVRPRIVLPTWVLELDERLQRLIVLHEREHVRAGDGRLLVAGLLLLVVLPWCLPLWWQFHRLRMAVEADCDRRLLRSGASARDYAQALLAVARRRRRAVLPLAAMARSKAALERRIRLIVAGPARGRERIAFALLATAALLSVAAAAVPVPQPPSPAALMAPLRSNPPGTTAVERGAPLPDGSLAGDPGEERLAAEIEAHHSAAIDAGLPAGSVIWFIVGRQGTVLRTGIERGTEREVEARVRARYPAETSDFAVLAWADVPAGAGEAGVVWLLPGP